MRRLIRVRGVICFWFRSADERGALFFFFFRKVFYLIIDLAVGGTSGWFPDDKGGKPWYDGSVCTLISFFCFLGVLNLAVV
jgi:hypothetical protein